MDWSRAYRTTPLARLGSCRYNDQFMKVSVFGIVLRTIAMIQDRVALGRKVRWAFPGEQLLIVPRAGALENAFYHRQSRSLQFYYGVLANRAGRSVFTALSQDIVAHETSHAIIDGIAPDLYDALSPESLAIHEGLADITAALLTMRNRELVRSYKSVPKAFPEFQRSSRFTRIAEEFGKWRGYGDALRDICNAKTLNPKERDPTRRVDYSSPHSVSEVLSGALFAVLRNEFAEMPRNLELVRALERDRMLDQRAWQIKYAVNRHEIYLPKEISARRVLVREALQRHILRKPPPRDAALGLSGNKYSFELLRSSVRARQEFVKLHSDTLGIAPRTPIRLACRVCVVYEPQLVGRMLGEVFFLSPVLKRWERIGESKHLVLKLRWTRTEPNNLPALGRERRFKSGATVVFDPEGRVRAVLRAGADPRQSAGRSSLLKRLLLNEGDGSPRIGPDGLPLQSAIRTRLRSGTLSVAGTFQALHIVGDEN